MNRLINLTPHDISVISNGHTVTLPVSGTIARATEINSVNSTINVNGESVEVVQIHYDTVEGLPEPQEGTGYVVSMLTALIAQRTGRSTADLYYPGDLARDENGQIVGCRQFHQVPTSPTRTQEYAMIKEITWRRRNGHPDVYPYSGLPETEAYIEALTGKTFEQLEIGLLH